LSFDSFAYVALLAATLLAFYGLPRRLRSWVLLAASVVFYGAFENWAGLPLIGLILTTAGVDYVASLRIDATADTRARRFWLAASLVVNLAILGYFKYANFFLDSLHELWPENSAFGRIAQIALPPGISFYTFQSMSYTIDVYRGHIPPARSFRRFFLFVMFFPQLVAGPIERSGHLLPQLDSIERARPTRNDVFAALILIVWGLFKKVVLSDTLALLVTGPYAEPAAHSSTNLLIATYAFALQIFFDFSAYSDIARGSAMLFGVNLMRNFRLPYLARNPSDFWRRWHISLSEWIRDYLYIPLGGNRGSRARATLVLLVTMALAGLWHGAAWHYVAWGLFHGLLLALHRLIARPLGAALDLLPAAAADLVRVVATFHLVCIGWVFFRAETIADAWLILGRLVSFARFALEPAGAQIFFFAFFCGAWLVMAAQERYEILRRLTRSSFGYGAFVAACVIGMALLGPESTTPFIYFQF
jgi:alginate O-acetyltransferase complex protein AlgI